MRLAVRLLAVALTLLSAPVSAQQGLHGKAQPSEQAQRGEFLLGIARTVNTLQKEHHEATATYLTRGDLEGDRILRTADGSLVGGLEFGKPDAAGFEFSLTTDTNGYTFALKGRRDVIMLSQLAQGRHVPQPPRRSGRGRLGRVHLDRRCGRAA